MIQGSRCQSQFRPCVHQSSKRLASHFSLGVVIKGKAFGIHFCVYLWYIAGSFLVFGHLFSSMSENWLRSRNWLWDPDFLYWATMLDFPSHPSLTFFCWLCLQLPICFASRDAVFYEAFLRLSAGQAPLAATYTLLAIVICDTRTSVSSVLLPGLFCFRILLSPVPFWSSLSYCQLSPKR